MFVATVRIVALVVVSLAIAQSGRQPADPLAPGRRTLLHAHNAYPEEGRWRDRVDRALGTGLPVVIEQDLAYAPRNLSHLRSVVSHEPELRGAEPPLEQHFFDRVRPLIERELAAKQTERWPAIVLHLDFKTNEREHHRAVWDLLRRHQAWLTTAPVDRDPVAVTPLTRGPVLVLTENGTNQEADFLEWSKEAGVLLLYGSIPPPELTRSDDPAERARLLRQAAPHELMPTAATSYRRWVNFPWAVVEEGGPPKADGWTEDDERRLRSIVGYAHQQRLLVRFYTLNGHTDAANRGWTGGYNFGSLDAVRARWRAAIKARVDLVATDQYEEFAGLLRASQ